MKAGSVSEIERLTREGSLELQKGGLDSALECLQGAYNLSQQGSHANVQRACAFNLGAVLIARRRPERGVEMLQRALPPDNQRDSHGHSTGDIFFNMGLAYEIQKRPREAVRYLELALDEYSRDCVPAMEAETAARLGPLYGTLGEALQTARVQGIAAAAHAALGQTGPQAMCMCRQASALLKAQKTREALLIAGDCIVLCRGVSDHTMLGNLYNDLGLLFTQCLDFPQAVACFEMALPLCQEPWAAQPGPAKHRKAVILQNLGAVYNSMTEFQRSLPYHQEAAQLHAALRDRKAQGQCFANLAYASSRLGNLEEAGECFLHAIQAARDAGDSHSEWQAMEGLGAISFHQGQNQRAAHYYKLALATLAKSGENNAHAHDRLIGKLSDVIQAQLTAAAMGSDVIKPTEAKLQGAPPVLPIDIRVNNLARPPTRQELRNMQELRNLRLERVAQTRKIPSEFERIALGIGIYDSDSDMSGRRKIRRQRSRRSHSVPERDEVDRQSGPADHVTSGGEQSRPGPSRRLSRRQSSLRTGVAANASGRRQGTSRPLLRTTDYDSAEEHRRKHGEKKGQEYAERLGPGSSSEAEGSGRGDRRRGDRRRGGGRNRSPGTAEDGHYPQQREAAPPVPREMLRGIPVLQTRVSLSDPDSEAGRVPRPPLGPRAPSGGQNRRPLHQHPASPSDSEQSHLTDSTLTPAPPARVRPKTARPPKASSETPYSSVSELGDSANQDLSQYESQLRAIDDEDGSATGTDVTLSTPSESGEEEDTPSEGQADGDKSHERGGQVLDLKGTHGPPTLSPPPPPKPSDNPALLATYEKPKDAIGSEQGDQSLMNSTRREDDPLYQTIKSLNSALQTSEPPQPGPSHAPDISPPLLPPRNRQVDPDVAENAGESQSNFRSLSRAEQELILYDMQKKRDENLREGAGRTSGDSVELPQRRERRNASRACLIM